MKPEAGDHVSTAAKDCATPHSRAVLEDCRLAYRLLDTEKDDGRWRLMWVAAVTLLRTVGHVLDKVDASNPNVRAVTNQLYEGWKHDDPKHEIFREFIDQERNNILKQYEFGVSQGPLLVSPFLVDRDGNEYQLEPAIWSENIYRPMATGPYEGEDGRTLIDDAIEWWQQQLDEVDHRVAQLAANGSAG
jgi:hypothetical protein